VAVVAVGVGMDLAVGVGMGLAVGVGMGLAEAVGFTGLLPMDWAAAGFMGLLPMVAWPTWGMGGVAMH
jgi:hypothetical protein